MKCEELRLELDNKENAYLRSEERRIRLWITQIKQQIILTCLRVKSSHTFMKIALYIVVF